MKVVGKYLDQALIDNPHSLRLFSPDELVSNKLDAVFDHTGRNFQWDNFSNAQGGRVIETLSEHVCQGFLQGYTLAGRAGVFPSYESFLGIIHTMMVQYSKFNKMARRTNPSFISAVLNLKPTTARVCLPPDANTFLSTLHHCLNSHNYINLMIGSKQPSNVYLSVEEAESHCRAGGSIFKFASTEEGLNLDVALVGVGRELTFEVIAAASLLRKRCPELRIRVINVTHLMTLGAEDNHHPHALSPSDYDALFPPSVPVHFNYHGYAQEPKGLLFGRPNNNIATIANYSEEGSTTTPSDMIEGCTWCGDEE